LLGDRLFGKYFSEATVEDFSCMYGTNSTREVPEEYETGRGRGVVGFVPNNLNDGMYSY